jgi:predicted N-acetyltransferase YhbS
MQQSMMSQHCNRPTEQKDSQVIRGAVLECANIKHLTPEVVQQLDTWMRTQFQSYTWLPSHEERDVDFVIARLNGEMIGRSAVVTREVRVGGQILTIMGIAGLIVRDDQRLQGLGKELMAATMNFVQKSPVPFCVLMCNLDLEKFYSPYGFKTIPGQNAVFSQPDGKIHEYKPHHGVTMVFQKPGRVWPEGLLDLQGLPF